MLKLLLCSSNMLLMFCFFIFFSSVKTISAQYLSAEDKIMLKEHWQKNTLIKEHIVEYAFKHSRPFIKYNPLFISLGGLLYLYQKYVSVQLSTDCIYTPSCSHYSALLIKRYGIHGIFLSADRLTRCNKFAIGDIPLGITPLENKKIVETTDIYSRTR